MKDDLLRGADEIAEYLFGDKKFRKRVYFLKSGHRLPIFNFRGGGLWARKSTLLDFIEKQERDSLK
jgi:hypothetical protein